MNGEILGCSTPVYFNQAYEGLWLGNIRERTLQSTPGRRWDNILKIDKREGCVCGVERSNSADYEAYCLLGCNTAHSGGSLLKLE